MSYSVPPRADENPSYLNENPGTVNSDSLAAESIRAGGDFAANSQTTGYTDQPSYSTTTNNTDTSAASRLDAAPNARARDEAGEDMYAPKTYRTPAEEVFGGGAARPSGARSADVDAAPTSISTDIYGVPSGGELKPKGKNITEGGFTGDEPNASMRANVGQKDDPGRYALGEFEGRNARSGLDSGYPDATQGADGGAGSRVNYENLQQTEAPDSSYTDTR